MYTLYHSPGACSLAVKAAFSMADLPLQTEIVNLMNAEHLTDEYRTINPKAKVPAVKFGDEVLTEGIAIFDYLHSLNPEAGLLPSDALQNAKTKSWLSFLYTTVNPNFSRVFFPSRFAADESDVKIKAEEAIHESFELIDSQLRQNDFIAGNELTAADLYLVVAIHWEMVLAKKLTDTYMTLQPYVARVFAHERVGIVLKEELAA
jgi:glutathione S-transferase